MKTQFATPLTVEQGSLEKIRERLCSHLRGKESLIEQALATFLAGGHLLLEGPPGTGKTSLAKAMASAFGGTFRRIQMTSDLLPSDITGILRIRPGHDEFEFRQGPIFANFVLADELNRTSPKAQSALLEAMEEGTVTVDGRTHTLPKPFFVVATQNPLEFNGVFPFAESQLDRFMLQICFDSPEKKDELGIYLDAAQSGSDARTATAELHTIVSLEEAFALRSQAARVHIEESVVHYATDVVRATRTQPDVSYGVSVRGGIQFIACAKALALVRGRDFVTPSDIRDLAPAALAHRLCFANGEPEIQRRRKLIEEILERIPAPK